MAAGLGKEVGSAATQNPRPHNADPGIRTQHLSRLFPIFSDSENPEKAHERQRGATID